MQLVTADTADGLRLPGYFSPGRDTCVLVVHGMAGSHAADTFAAALADALAEAGVGVLYAHTRGYGHVSDIPQVHGSGAPEPPERRRVGTTYELFEDCVLDLDAWTARCRNLGASRIVLLGHSLGCNKVLHYLHLRRPPDVVGVVLASPPDLVGLVELEGYQPDHDRLLAQARRLVAARTPRQLLDADLWGEYRLSAQTYLSLFDPGGPADNLPVLRNPPMFPELASVSQPILLLMGEHDDIAIRGLREDLEVLARRATAAASVECALIPGANHRYDRCEAAFATAVGDWLHTVA